MEENEIAKRGHNKARRYDLNEISYYITCNYGYVPYSGDSYAGNIPGPKTFSVIVENTPENAILIYDRGYNSEKNVDLIQDRRYIIALTQSDYRDFMALPFGKKSFIEAEKTCMGESIAS
ncbi:MAG: hypothetical protein QW292_12300 [Candidatus Parvarchaeota archaeon]